MKNNNANNEQKIKRTKQMKKKMIPTSLKRSLLIVFMVCASVLSIAPPAGATDVIVPGEQWLDNRYFRFGASSLANALFQSFSGTDEKPF